MLERSDVRTRKRDRTRSEIVAAAWELARRDGVAALSLRELAAKVGMRAPSLYTYFPSKNDLYDAMFAQGMQEFADELNAVPIGPDPRENFRNIARKHARVSVADPARYELLFHRPVPDFVPKPESLNIGLKRFAATRAVAAAAGLSDQRAFDLFIGTSRGLIAMQIANEPGGDHWISLMDEAVDTFIERFAPAEKESASSRKPRKRAR